MANRSLRKVIPAIIVLVVLVASLAIGSQLVQRRQHFSSLAAVPNGVDLSLSTANSSPHRGDTITVNLLIDAKTYQVSAASVSATFPANQLQLVSITAGPFFTQNFVSGSQEMLLKTDTATAGVGNISIGAPCPVTLPTPLPTANPCLVNTGSGTLATFTFQVLPAATAHPQIAFDAAHTAVAALGQSANMVGTLTPLSLTIAGTLGDGLKGEYFSNGNLSSSPTTTRIDPTVDFDWGRGSPAPNLPTNGFSVRWTGFIVPPGSGTYTFYVDSDDGNRLWVNNAQITNRWSNGPQENSGTVSLTAGQSYPVRLEMYESIKNAHVYFKWLGSGISSKTIVAKQYLFSQ